MSNGEEAGVSDEQRLQYYGLILESLSSGVLAFDASGIITVANPAACEHLGLKPGVLRPGLRLDGVGLPAPFMAALNEVRDGQRAVRRREVVVTGSDGTRHELGLSISMLHGPEAFNGAAVLFVDMTERRALERVAELNRQLAQVGELTAGVVHEIRNPVTVIGCHAELLERRIKPDEPGWRSVAAIASEAKNLERLAAQFLTFSKPFELDLTVRRPETIAVRAFTLCQANADKKKVKLEQSVPPGLPEFRCDYERLAQAMANIVGNAVDAVPAGGMVSVSAVMDDSVIEYGIADNGPGVHIRDDENIFSPFFSKKEGGTGLGLAIAHRIVTAHGGSVTYANRPEGGVRFAMRIPGTLA